MEMMKKTVQSWERFSLETLETVIELITHAVRVHADELAMLETQCFASAYGSFSVAGIRYYGDGSCFGCCMVEFWRDAKH